MSRVKNFFVTLKRSSTDVEFYSSDKKLSDALIYFIILIVLSSFLMSLTLLSFFENLNLDEIPDFEIRDGKLSIDAEQPYYVWDNFVIDTTGQITEPILDEDGEGILITEDTLIRKQSIREQRAELAGFEWIIQSKEDLRTAYLILQLILIPIMFIFMFIFSFIEKGFYVILLSGVGYILTRRKYAFKLIFSKCVYAFTPLIIFSLVAWMIGTLYVPNSFDRIGQLWTLIIFGLVLKKYHI